MSKRPTVLITRPEPAAHVLASEIQALGWQTFIEPMLFIKPLAVSLPLLQNYSALVFTSANGVNAYAYLTTDRSLPAITVGSATAEAAKRAGFLSVHEGPGDAKSLSAELSSLELAPKPLLHLSGEHIAAPIIVPGKGVDRLAIYKAEAASDLSPACLDNLDKGHISDVMFFSPRTASIFSALLDQYARTDTIHATKALCIADSVIKSLRVLNWGDVQVARTPDRRGMLDLLSASDRGLK